MVWENILIVYRCIYEKYGMKFPLFFTQIESIINQISFTHLLQNLTVLFAKMEQAAMRPHKHVTVLMVSLELNVVSGLVVIFNVLWSRDTACLVTNKVLL